MTQLANRRLYVMLLDTAAVADVYTTEPAPHPVRVFC